MKFRETFHNLGTFSEHHGKPFTLYTVRGENACGYFYNTYAAIEGAEYQPGVRPEDVIDPDTMPRFYTIGVAKIGDTVCLAPLLTAENYPSKVYGWSGSGCALVDRTRDRILRAAEADDRFLASCLEALASEGVYVFLHSKPDWTEWEEWQVEKYNATEAARGTK